MIYGNADFMDVPMEVLINSYKNKLDITPKSKLKDYVNSFLNYLQNLNIYTKNSEANFVISNAYAYLNSLPKVNSLEELENILQQDNNIYRNHQGNIKLDQENFNNKYAEILLQVLGEKFKSQVVSELYALYLDTIYQVICSSSVTNSIVGLVIAGYGGNEIFPSMYSLELSGYIDGQIKYKNDKEEYVTTNPLFEDESKIVRGAIKPFAQREMIDTIINGIDPNLHNQVYTEFSDTYNNVINYLSAKEIRDSQGNNALTAELKEHLKERIINRRWNEFNYNITQNYSTPIISMLSSLSVSELGQMAHTLINLTSFKRKISGDIRTVGGAIKVLTISHKNGVQVLNSDDINNAEYDS